jgi:hypothetical protein
VLGRRDLEAYGKATRYFLENVLKKRPYIKPEWISKARAGEVVEKKIQPDGRIRVWLHLPEEGKYLRVVFLEDGETVHNAFYDRTYKGGKE